MRRVSFTVLGGVGGETEEQGTVADLLEATPYALSAGLIPPLHVVNDLLRTGGHDAGMSGGCLWEPFEITAPEWTDVADALRASTEDGERTFVEPPGWVTTFDEWNAWIMIFKYGYPEEFRELERESRELDRALKQATRDGDAARAEELYLRASEAGERLAEFVMRHRPRGRD